MLQFLYPIGLLAAAGMIVPVIIHLWNIKNGKTLKVGSISLLGLPANQRSSNLRVSDWPLLFLRCLLIVLIALLLSAPLFNAIHSGSKNAGWVLVEKQRLHELWIKNRKEIDSLQRKGYELRDFNTGFSRLDWKDTSTVFSAPGNSSLSYFSLIRQLNTELAPGTKVYLYTGNRLTRFAGSQPTTSLQLKWKVFPAQTEEQTWVAAAFDLNKDKVRKVIAHSTSAGDFYKIEDSKRIVTAGVRMDASKLQVLIFENNQSADARYLKAAIRAIADYTQQNIQIINITSLSQVTNSASFVFWLSDQVLSPAQLKQLPVGVTFFNYAGKKPEKVKSVFHDQTGSVEAALYQRTKFVGQTQQSIWADGFGEPLLSLDTASGIKHYQFYSRFNQNWTNLVWTNGLVMGLMPLVIPHQEPEFGFTEDKRSVRSLSSMPELVYQHKPAGAIFYQKKPLSNLFWWLVLVVFFIERVVTYRKLERRL